MSTDQVNDSDAMRWSPQPCATCKGEGLVKDHDEWPFPGEKRCPTCKGSGHATASETALPSAEEADR